jgi:hypothetical protein
MNAIEFASLDELHRRVVNTNGLDRAAAAELRSRQLELRAGTGGTTTAADRLDQLQSRRNGPESPAERVVGLWAGRDNSPGADPRQLLLGLRARRLVGGW